MTLQATAKHWAGNTCRISFSPHLFPLPRYPLRGGGEETTDSYFPPDAKLPEGQPSIATRGGGRRKLGRLHVRPQRHHRPLAHLAHQADHTDQASDTEPRKAGIDEYSPWPVISRLFWHLAERACRRHTPPPCRGGWPRPGRRSTCRWSAKERTSGDAPNLGFLDRSRPSGHATNLNGLSDRLD